MAEQRQAWIGPDGAGAAGAVRRRRRLSATLRSPHDATQGLSARRVSVCGVGVPSKAYIISTRTLLPSRISLVGIPILATVAYMLNLHSSTATSAAI